MLCLTDRETTEYVFLTLSFHLSFTFLDKRRVTVSDAEIVKSTLC